MEQFKCDKCGGAIESPQQGEVEYLKLKTKRKTSYGFKIVHTPAYSPFAMKRGIKYCWCYTNAITGRRDIPLEKVLTQSTRERRVMFGKKGSRLLAEQLCNASRENIQFTNQFLF